MLWSPLTNKNVANLGARQSSEVRRVSFFSDAFSATAKILAHLQVSQLYVIFNAADCMSSGQLKFGTEFW